MTMARMCRSPAGRRTCGNPTPYLVAGAGELELALASGGLAGMGLGRTADRSRCSARRFPGRGDRWAVDEEAVVRVEFAVRLELLDRIYTIGAGLETFRGESRWPAERRADRWCASGGAARVPDRADVYYLRR